MNLHTNTQLFRELIIKTSLYYNVPEEIVERDYWLTAILYRFNNHEMSKKLCIKGGTVLKFHYDLIDRIVYDIDFVPLSTDISNVEIRKMFSDLLFGAHYSTDESHILQHVKWYPYDHINFSTEIRMDYFVGEIVLKCSKKSIMCSIQKFIKEHFYEYGYIFEDYDMNIFDLYSMDIDNIFVEKLLACSDKYIRERTDECIKHLNDLIAIYKNYDLNFENIKKIMDKKIEHDKKLLGCDRIDRVLEFDVFYLDIENNKLDLSNNVKEDFAIFCSKIKSNKLI